MADTIAINMCNADSIKLLHEYYMDYSHLSTNKTTFYMPKIKKVIFNDPATIVIWSDNTKTVVKAENEAFDKEKGLAMAISKKALGNKGNYYEEFKKWINYDEAEPEYLDGDLSDEFAKVRMSINEAASVLVTGDK